MNAPGSVVVVGSLNVDHVLDLDRLSSTGETRMTHRYRRLGGGKGANQAAAAAQMGISTRMVGFVGRDSEGEQVVNELARSGVDVSGIRVTPDVPTGAAFLLVDSRGANQIVVAPGANAMLDAAAVRSELDRLIAPASRMAALVADRRPLKDAVSVAVRAASESTRFHGARSAEGVADSVLSDGVTFGRPDAT